MGHRKDLHLVGGNPWALAPERLESDEEVPSSTRTIPAARLAQLRREAPGPVDLVQRGSDNISEEQPIVALSSLMAGGQVGIISPGTSNGMDWVIALHLLLPEQLRLKLGACASFMIQTIHGIQLLSARDAERLTYPSRQAMDFILISEYDLPPQGGTWPPGASSAAD